MISKNAYFYIYANVFLVKGHIRTMICDLSKRKWEFIDNSYFELSRLFRKHKIKDIANLYVDKESLNNFEEFIIYLLDNDYGTFVDNIDNFPEIDLKWDSPHTITNAIIDVNRTSSHDYNKIVSELSLLNCEHIQVRSYNRLTKDQIERIATVFSNNDFKSIHFMVKYNQELDFSFLSDIIDRFPSISFTIHSSPKNKFYQTSISSLLPSMGYVQYIKQKIHSCDGCGLINKNTFNIPQNLQTFIEGTMYNSCLNRKISIDTNGDIKNCPSMDKSYGNISEYSLERALKTPEFKSLWTIGKDQIDICKDCEYRYVCSDCRAYIEQADDIYSKPKKCNYDPYKGKWVIRNTSTS